MSAAARTIGIAGVLLAVTIASRLPFYFPAVINWDESTYVIIAQSLLGGHLPYVEAWTLKPPLLFVFFAAALKLFGHSLISVRVAGTLCVAATALVVYRIGERCWSRAAGVFAALLLILVVALVPAGQATMTEIVLLPFFVAAMYLLLFDDGSNARLGWAGVLIAVATLVRLNTAYAVVAAGLFIAADRRGRPKDTIRALALFAAGGLAVLAATCLPYVFAGEGDLLWKSLVRAPLAYSTSQQTAADNLWTLARSAVGWEPDVGWAYEGRWLTGFVFLAGGAGLFALLGRWRERDRDSRRVTILLVLLGAGTLLGIVKGGAAYDHYLIQLVPFAALLAAAFAHYQAPILRYLTWGLAAALLLVSLPPLTSEYRTMLSHVSRGEPLRYGAAYDIADYLRRENPSRRPVFLVTDHIVYWLLGFPSPTRLATHPSNIFKPYLVDAMTDHEATSEDELLRVFEQRPEFVVTVDGRDEWALGVSAWDLFEKILNERYVRVAQIQGRNIYRIGPSGPAGPAAADRGR